VDYHNHICGTTIDEMVASASALGLREFGISEHIFQLDEGHVIFPQQSEDGIRFSRDWYVETCRQCALAAPVDVRLGLEVDYLPGTEDAVASLLDGAEWDYLIGSIHEVGPHDIFLYDPSGAEEGQQLWRRYYELFIAAAAAGTFDILSHPVRNMERNPFVPDDLDDLLVEVASAARANDVALELNGDDMTNWPQLVRRVARACGRTGCPISLGSDAHAPSDVGQQLANASRVAAEEGVRHVVSFQRRERRLIPLA
jgi:histidinol-phosphatase (PHP family)